MDILISILVILGILIGVVIYQSRKEKYNPRLYLERFSRLIVIIINYFKNVGVCAGQKFREINWDLTYQRTVPTNESINDVVIDKHQRPIDNRKLSVYGLQDGGGKEHNKNKGVALSNWGTPP